MICSIAIRIMAGVQQKKAAANNIITPGGMTAAEVSRGEESAAVLIFSNSILKRIKKI